MNKIFTIILVFFFFPAFSQNIKIEKKKAKIAMENKNYTEAITIYQKIISEKNNEKKDRYIYLNLGYCYFETSSYFEAIKYLEKYVENNKTRREKKSRNSIYSLDLLARSYFKTYNFIEAKKIYKDIDSLSKTKEYGDLRQKIIQCDSAEKMFENPKGFFVYRPGIINSDYPDYCPVMSISQGKIYFTSRRPGSTGGKIADDGYEYEDIYSVDINNGNYSKPVNIGPPINTDGYEATSSISSDGKTLFIYKSSDKDAGDIYSSNLKNGKWSVPKRMLPPINSKYRETHASLSPNGKYIYFTSDRKGGYGGLDIYQAELSSDGKWTNVKNLGAAINTPKDEAGPFISPDGRFLYFSSNGHLGMGGFDIFRCKKKKDGTWSKPVNMGFPLNTVDDDLFYVPTNNPEEALYSSKQFGGVSSILFVKIFDDNTNSIFVHGYTFDSRVRFLNNKAKSGDSIFYNKKLYPFNKKIYVKNDTFHIFYTRNNVVMDSICKIPANSFIKVFDVKNGSLAGDYVPSINGKYELTISRKGKFIVYFGASGYSYNFLEIKGNKTKYFFNAELDTLVSGKVKIVKYFAFNKDSVKLNSFQIKELDFLADFLKRNKNLCVDISAHNYNGTNKKIDTLRTEKISNYLLQRGIDSSHIFFNLSSDIIGDSLVQYTIYDTSLARKIIKENKTHYKLLANKIIHGVLVNDVRFELNMYNNPNFYGDLDFLSEFLVNNRTSKIAVYGYTDIQGSSRYNKILSQKRANFVRNYLLRKGVNKDQVVAQGRGFSKQIAKNKDNRGRYLWQSMKYNRRVEIEILRQGINEKLFVKPIDVPNQFQINISVNTYHYSINLFSSEKKIPASAFNFDVTELKGVDGLYNYIYGEFEHEFDADNFANSIRSKYPKAFVFINNYRK